MRGLAVSLGVRRPSQGHLEVGVERVRVLAVDSDLAEERELGLRVRGHGPQGAWPARSARVRRPAAAVVLPSDAAELRYEHVCAPGAS